MSRRRDGVECDRTSGPADRQIINAPFVSKTFLIIPSTRARPKEMQMSTLTPPAPSSLLTPQEAAEFLRTKDRTLERWRQVGGGPIFTKVGRRVVYKISDLESWVLQQRRSHTGSAGAPALPAA
jgi:Helix-turn-helix domain